MPANTPVYALFPRPARHKTGRSCSPHRHIMKVRSAKQKCAPRAFCRIVTGAKKLMNFIGQLDEGTLWKLALREGEDDFYAEPVAGNAVGTELTAQFGNLYTRTLSDFGEAILHGGTAFIDPMECVRDQRIIDAAYESSRTGRTVFL